MLARNVPVETESLKDQPGMMRTGLRRPLAQACAFFVPVMALVIGGTAWWEVSQGRLAPWEAGVLAASGCLLTLGLVWFAGVGLTTYGIAVSEKGILVFDRTVKRGRVLRWSMEWGEMREVTTNPGNIWLAVGPSGPGVSGTYLSYEQARAVLTDPRCPLRNHLPADVARRIKVGSGSLQSGGD